MINLEHNRSSAYVHTEIRRVFLISLKLENENSG